MDKPAIIENNLLQFEWIAPQDLHFSWELIKQGLEQVRRYGDHWLVEDVYLALKTGQSNLHIGTLNDDYKGFVITTQVESFDGPVLHIWAVYSNERKEADLLSLGMPQIEQWAKNIKANRITFHSPRKGWEKNKLGFKPQTVIFEKEI